MTRNMRAAFWLAGALAVMLAVTINPLVAGFALAGISLALIAVLMGMQAARAIDDWRVEHPWRFGRRRSTSAPPVRQGPAEHEARRAA